MIDIVCLGELLVDFTQCGYTEGGMRRFEQNPGGAPANVAAAAARLGAKAAFIGKVGADMHGDFLRAALERAGVDTRGLIAGSEVFTTLAFVSLGENGERSFSFARKPGADTQLRPDELDEALLKNTRALHIGSLSLTHEPARTATLRAVELAKNAGALISYDPNYRASLWPDEATAIARMRALIPLSDVVKLSDAEAPLLCGLDDPQQAAAAIAAQGPRLVCVTCGEDGAWIWAKNETRHVKGFLANAVDTTGAGDAFLGAFLYRFLLSGVKPEDADIALAAACARFANAAASLCVQKRGAIPAMPTPGEVEARLKA